MWTIRAATLDDQDGWQALRVALWPDEDAAALAADLPRLVADPARYGNFVAEESGVLIGFAEASLRHDYVNGTESSPVGFLEGWFVAPLWRKQGVGRALVAAVERWSRERGCSELASDALLDNQLSHAAHAACAFEETERVVYFRKRL